MATRRQKKEKAKSLLPTIPVPIRRLTPAGRLYQAATIVAQGLIDADPLGIITDDQGQRSLEFVGPRENPLKEIINDPSIKITPELMEVINDDSVVMVNDELVRAENLPVSTSPAIGGRDFIRSSGQFRRDLILPRTTEATKRTRKKTKTDKNMSKALRQANERFRTKKGKLRKGATQAQIMKFAHKLLKRM